MSDYNQAYQLHMAVQTNDYAAVLNFLTSENGYNAINQPDEHGNAPLTYAMINNDYKTASLLLLYGANGFTFSPFGKCMQSIKDELNGWSNSDGAHLLMALRCGWQSATFPDAEFIKCQLRAEFLIE